MRAFSGFCGVLLIPVTYKTLRNLKVTVIASLLACFLLVVDKYIESLKLVLS